MFYLESHLEALQNNIAETKPARKQIKVVSNFDKELLISRHIYIINAYGFNPLVGFRDALECIDSLVDLGFIPFSPIVFGHSIVEFIWNGKDKIGHDDWIKFSEHQLSNYIDICLIVRKEIKESKGVKKELDIIFNSTIEKRLHFYFPNQEIWFIKNIEDSKKILEEIYKDI